MEGAGLTGSYVIQKQMDYQQDNEMAQANYLRQRCLAEIHHQNTMQEHEQLNTFATQRADKEFGRGPSGLLDSMTGAPLSREEYQSGEHAATTSEEYKQGRETTRSQEIGTATEDIAKDFKWDAKNPQQSAIDFMQQLRATGRLSPQPDHQQHDQQHNIVVVQHPFSLLFMVSETSPSRVKFNGFLLSVRPLALVLFGPKAGNAFRKRRAKENASQSSHRICLSNIDSLSYAYIILVNERTEEL